MNELTPNEKNMRDALELARGIYRVCQDERFRQTEPEIRHRVLVAKYPNFAKAYPVILRYLARELKYSESAFRQFLHKLEVDPGRGMEGFIARQADYARFLYIEECRKSGKHWNAKVANGLWKAEYDHMYASIKKLEKEEKAAKNEFHEENELNLQIRRQELLEFINSADPLENGEIVFEPVCETPEPLVNELPEIRAACGVLERQLIERKIRIPACPITEDVTEWRAYRVTLQDRLDDDDWLPKSGKKSSSRQSRRFSAS